LAQSSGFALERHFFRAVPIHGPAELFDESDKLARAQERRRSTAEVDESQWALRERGVPAVKRDLVGERGHVGFHVASVFFGVDPKVAELAALATKGNVKIEPKRHIGMRRSP
jgi:hypothetical protein